MQNCVFQKKKKKEQEIHSALRMDKLRQIREISVGPLLRSSLGPWLQDFKMWKCHGKDLLHKEHAPKKGFQS